MKNVFRFSDQWELLFWTTFVIVILLGLIIGFNFATSTKTLNEYYLHHSAGPYKIYINWENAPDEVAFKTYNHKLALETLKALNDSLE